jgi:hypothetical protein
VTAQATRIDVEYVDPTMVTREKALEMALASAHAEIEFLREMLRLALAQSAGKERQ